MGLHRLTVEWGRGWRGPLCPEGRGGHRPPPCPCQGMRTDGAWQAAPSTWPWGQQVKFIHTGTRGLGPTSTCAGSRRGSRDPGLAGRWESPHRTSGRLSQRLRCPAGPLPAGRGGGWGGAWRLALWPLSGEHVAGDARGQGSSVLRAARLLAVGKSN